MLHLLDSEIYTIELRESSQTEFDNKIGHQESRILLAGKLNRDFRLSGEENGNRDLRLNGVRDAEAGDAR